MNDTEKKEEQTQVTEPLCEETVTRHVTDIIEPPLVEPHRFFTAPKWAWAMVLTLWLIGGIVTILYFNYSYISAIGYLVLFGAWLFYCYETIDEKHRAKPIFLGQIGKKNGSGPCEVLKPFEKLSLISTEVQEVNLVRAGIQTKKGKTDDGEEIPRITLPVEVAVLFQFPWDDDELTALIRNAPDPENIDAIRNKVEEPLNDVVRTEGGKHDYLWIQQKRTDFAEAVTEMLKGSKDLLSLIRLFKFKNMITSFKHIETPDAIKNAQSSEASATYEGRALKTKTILKAQGDKEATILGGDARASAEAAVRTAILKVLTTKEYSDVAMKLEGMKAFVDASQGGKGTIIFPTELLTALGGQLGSKSSGNVLEDLEKLGVDKEKLAQIIASILTQKKE